MWESIDRTNWRLILSESRTVVYKNNTRPGDKEYDYTPIPPFYATPNSYALLIGVRSENARQHWFLGARVSQYLYISPSPNNNLMSGVQTSDVKKIGLGRLTLLEFSNYNILPYVLEIKIPYWLEDVYIEVWEHSQAFVESSKITLADIYADLTAIKEKLDIILGQ